MIVIFDVDGTLIGGEEQDWPSFDAAIRKITGVEPDETFWKTVTEVTGRSIVKAAARQAGIEASATLESQISREYLNNLRRAAPFKGEVFRAKKGAIELLQLLRSTQVFKIAIATGDFRETSQFKLGSACVDIRGIPFASSSDREARHEIIRLAAERANADVEEAVYVGDGPWDWKACETLGIPFIGTGMRPDRLRDIGATHVVDDLHPSRFLPVLNGIMNAP